MKKLLTLILVLCSIVGFAQIRGGAQYDPGAARSNLSNVDAAATPSMTSITLSDKVKAAWADILGDIYASGTVKVSTGTAAAPAYSFASDPNTGVYSPAADNLAVSVAGAEALRVNSAGEVLIATGTDAGDYKLQLVGTGLFVNDAFDKHIVLRRGLNDTHLSPTTSPDNGLWVWAGSDFTKGVKTFASGTFLINTGPLLIATNTETIGFKLINNGKAYFTDEVLIATSTDAGDYTLQVNGNAYVKTTNGTCVVNQMTLADDATINTSSLIGVNNNVGTILITTISGGANAAAHVHLSGSSNVVTDLGSFNSAITDTDTKLCVFPAGAGDYTIKNRLGAPGIFIFQYVGR